jgi:hypothetical protein
MGFGILQVFVFLKTRIYSTRKCGEHEQFVLGDLGVSPPSVPTRLCLVTLLFAPLNCSIGGEVFKQYLMIKANHYLVRQSKREKTRQS